MPRLKKKRRKERRDKVPYSRVRTPISRTGGPMKSKKTYTRKKKHKREWKETD